MTATTTTMFSLQSTGRSGTTYVSSLLNSHPSITVYKEILYPEPYMDLDLFYEFWAQHIREDAKNLGPNRSPLVAQAYLERLKAGSPSAVAGLDLKLEQLDLVPWLWDQLHRAVEKSIVLRRHNLLKQVVSEVVMHQRLTDGTTAGIAEVHSGTVPEKRTVQLDAKYAIQRMRYRKELTDRYLRKLQDAGRPHLIVSYEDLLGSRAEDVLDRMQRFLGVEPRSLTSPLRKQNPYELSELVSNYEQVVRAVNDSEFAYTLYLPT